MKESQQRQLWGLIAEFERPEPLRQAAQRARAAGYRRIEACSPHPVEGLAEALGLSANAVPWSMLTGGALGGVGAWFMMWYSATIDYPIHVGGRPLKSWPSFIPIIFELAVLAAALTGLILIFVLNGLPRPHHPLFGAPGFERATCDRYFLCIEAADPQFEKEKTWELLEIWGGKVSEVTEDPEWG